MLYFRAVSWFARHRKVESLADSMAAHLFESMVQDQTKGEDPKSYQIPTAILGDFRAKMQLYREALVLLVLSSEARNDTRYDEVLKSYERLILPGTPTPEGLEKVDKLNDAMRDLSSLISGSHKRREAYWAKDWMNSIGHEEWNPVILMLFSSYWMQNYIAIASSLKEISRTVL